MRFIEDKAMKNCLIIILFCGCVLLSFHILRPERDKSAKPLESYLVQQVDDPNWIDNYGDDLDSRLVYNVAVLNRIVNNQGIALKQLLEDPNR